MSLIFCSVHSYLKQEVRGVMDEHDQSANADVVGAVGEPKQGNGSDVVDNLFFEILGQKSVLIRHF